jgi:uncharacterized protein
MPEYLAPGVYVEEVSFRSKTIEGVPTSTTGFAGMTRFGPVQFPDGPTTTEPRLITSFTEFERVYGGLEPLVMAGEERLPYLAHAARAFFMNGGKRLYVSRVFTPNGGGDGVASRPVTVGGGMTHWRARWPGRFGNVWVGVQVMRSRNVAFQTDSFGGTVVQARRARRGAVVEVLPAAPSPPSGNDPLDIDQLRAINVDIDGRQRFIDSTGTAVDPPPDAVIQLIELNVSVVVDAERTDFYPELGLHPWQTRYVGRILERDDPADESSVVWLDWDPRSLGATEEEQLAAALQLAVGLQQNPDRRLENGSDGNVVSPDDLAGSAADPDDAAVKATGLEALGEIDDIAIVALPDGGTYEDRTLSEQAADRLINHAQSLRYRIAVVDPPPESSLNQVRAFRGRFDSKYAALYYPWIEILDPLQRLAQGAPPRTVQLPPSGFVCGIYARTDIERGVHKAPANEVVMGLTQFEHNVNKARQEVLNPEGINALRFFEGRGNRVWGARTMSSDPEWKYVNVRRLFIYLEHSIDKATQWAVFEPNNDRLWANIRRSVEDFLLIQWRNGALIGETPEKAYFVRCDRTTMTQNDLDNGRLICLIGVAPTKPAEFVIFRIGQWTGDAVTTPTS